MLKVLGIIVCVFAIISIIWLMSKFFRFIFCELYKTVDEIDKKEKSINTKKQVEETPREKCDDFYPYLLYAAEIADKAIEKEINSSSCPAFSLYIKIHPIPEKKCIRLIMTSVVDNSSREKEYWSEYLSPVWEYSIDERGRGFVYRDIYPRYTNDFSGWYPSILLNDVHPEWSCHKTAIYLPQRKF